MQAQTNYVSGSTSNISTFNYDQSDHLQSVYIQDGRPRTISFVTDVNGQILTGRQRTFFEDGDYALYLDLLAAATAPER